MLCAKWQVVFFHQFLLFHLYQAEIKDFSKLFQRNNKHTTALQGFKIVYRY